MNALTLNKLKTCNEKVQQAYFNEFQLYPVLDFFEAFIQDPSAKEIYDSILNNLNTTGKYNPTKRVAYSISLVLAIVKLCVSSKQLTSQEFAMICSVIDSPSDIERLKPLLHDTLFSNRITLLSKLLHSPSISSAVQCLYYYIEQYLYLIKGWNFDHQHKTEQFTIENIENAYRLYEYLYYGKELAHNQESSQSSNSKSANNLPTQQTNSALHKHEQSLKHENPSFQSLNIKNNYITINEKPVWPIKNYREVYTAEALSTIIRECQKNRVITYEHLYKAMYRKNPFQMKKQEKDRIKSFLEYWGEQIAKSINTQTNNSIQSAFLFNAQKQQCWLHNTLIHPY